jgi:hypothetical protein
MSLHSQQRQLQRVANAMPLVRALQTPSHTAETHLLSRIPTARLSV